MSFNALIIKESFEKIKPVSDQTVTKLFDNLWNDFPESKNLFSNTNMPQQKEAFFKAWTYLMDHLEDSERLNTYLKALGGRHVNYGIDSARSFEWMGTSLMKTLGETLGAGWTAEIQGEWTKAITSFSNTMIEGLTMVQQMRQGAGTTVKGHLHVAPPVATAVAQNPEPVAAPTYINVKATTDSNSYDLPENVKQQIQKAAHDFVAAKIQEEYNKALKAALAKINPNEFIDSMKKAS